MDDGQPLSVFHNTHPPFSLASLGIGAITDVLLFNINVIPSLVLDHCQLSDIKSHLVYFAQQNITNIVN